MKKARPGFPEPRLIIPRYLLVAITATAATAATSAAIFATTAASTASARTLFAWASDVDGEGAAVQLRAIQGVDGLLRLFRRAHRDEAESTRFARYAVHQQVGLDDRAMRREVVLEIVFGGVEGKISNKQFCTHVLFYCATNAAFTRLFPTIGFQIVTETSSPEDFPCRGIDKLSNSGRNMDYSGGIATDFFKNLFTLVALSADRWLWRATCRQIPAASGCAITSPARFRAASDLSPSIGRGRHARSQCVSGNPSGRPCRLEIEPAGDAVNVEQFTGKIEAGANPAFHRLEIHFAQTHAAAGDKFVLVQALPRDLEFGANQLLSQPVLGRARKGCPSRVGRDAGSQNELFPQTRRQRRNRRVDDKPRGLPLTPRMKFGRNRLRPEARQPVHLKWKPVIQSMQHPRPPRRQPQNHRPAQAPVRQQQGAAFAQPRARR